MGERKKKKEFFALSPLILYALGSRLKGKKRGGKRDLLPF